MPKITLGETIKVYRLTNKVKKSDYSEIGAFPIVDQGDELISGYHTGEEEPVKEVPVIAFGDHTRRIKYINFYFYPGADGLKVFKPNNNFLTNYLYYFLLANTIKNYGYERHFKYLKDLEIEIRPKNEQIKISQILYNYDLLIENNTKRIKILEEMAQTIYTEWFVNFRFPGHENVKFVDSELGKIPEGWDNTTLEEQVDLIKGISYKGEFLTEGGTPMVNLKSVGVNGGFNREATKPYAGKHRDDQYINNGDVIIANTDMTQAGNVIGSPAIINGIDSEEIIFSHHLYKTVIKDTNKLTVFFLYHLLLSSNFKNYCKGVSSGTTVLGLRGTDILDFSFLIPPKNIIETFEDVISPIHKESWYLQDKNQNLGNTRDLLIPKLISGEIDVSELNIDVEEEND